ncbi:MAG TPA: ATP-grasp domain-containing protein [Burkholderiales bacterium]|nr:ATP-grasp domain-containing protein [Burkholderiales bacterium]
MRIFVYEHITGGGLLDQVLPSGLVQEGDMMLKALLRDLGDLSDTEIVTMRDWRLPALGFQVTVFTPRNTAEAGRILEHCTDDADAVWPIAPESEGVLERIHRMVLKHGRRLLGCHPDAVRVTASKQATARCLTQAGIAAVPTFLPDEILHDASGKWVVKPDDGAGCSETRLFHNLPAARRWLNSNPGNFVLQPYISGNAQSLCVLCRKGNADLLSCNDQRVVVRDGQFQFLGTVVNAVTDGDGAFEDLARRVAAAIPGLWGYVGIDLVQGRSQRVVMEVNPRLTTSYAGLRQALGRNPAALVLSLMDETKPFRLPKFSPCRVEVDLGAVRA